MSVEFLRVRNHWKQPLPDLPDGRVVFLELSPGQSPQSSNSISLNLFLDGSLRYEVAERTLHVVPGQLLILPGGWEALMIVPNAGTTRAVCIYLPASLLPCDDGYEGASPLLTGPLLLDTGVVPFARQLTQLGHALTRGADLSSRAAGALVRQGAAAVQCLLQELAAKLELTGATKLSTRLEIVQRVERVRAFVNDHPGTLLTLAEQAALAGMSQFHFARCFKAVVGMSPIAYGTLMQIQEGDRLLKAGIPIEIVAEQLGFAERSTFARAYRRVLGNTPKVGADVSGIATPGSGGASNKTRDPRRISTK